MTLSAVSQGGTVPFPAFTGERVYMRRFERASGLPLELERWQPTVDAMLLGVENDGPAFIMIDQRHVRAGERHRRGGLHVDWYWRDVMQAHGGPPGHRPVPAPHHYPPSPGHSRASQAREAVILAASSLGCRAYVGEFEGTPLDDGDAAHIDISGLRPVDMLPGTAWVCDAAGTLHETLPEFRDTLRTVVRLNVAAWRPS